MRHLLSAAAIAAMTFGTAALAGPNEPPAGDPGVGGRENAFNAPGFAVAAEKNGKGLDHAADLFGDNGKGNGADPDAFGLEGDHDPGNFGGGPDTSR